MYKEGLTLKIICKYIEYINFAVLSGGILTQVSLIFFSASLEVQEALGPRVCQKTAEQQRIYDFPFEQIMTEVIKESV